MSLYWSCSPGLLNSAIKYYFSEHSVIRLYKLDDCDFFATRGTVKTKYY